MTTEEIRKTIQEKKDFCATVKFDLDELQKSHDAETDKDKKEILFGKIDQAAKSLNDAVGELEGLKGDLDKSVVADTAAEAKKRFDNLDKATRPRLARDVTFAEAGDGGAGEYRENWKAVQAYLSGRDLTDYQKERFTVGSKRHANINFADSVGQSGIVVPLAFRDTPGGGKTIRFADPMVSTAAEQSSLAPAGIVRQLYPYPTDGQVIYNMVSWQQADYKSTDLLIQVGKYGGAVPGYVATEGTTKPRTEVKFDKVTVQHYELAASGQVSNTLLRRSVIELEAEIFRTFDEICRDKIEQDILTGTGTGMPLGILNTTGLQAIARAGAGAVTRLDVNAMLFGTKPLPQSIVRNGAYVLNPAVQLALMNLGTDTTLFQPSMANGAYSTLNGKRYEVTDYLPALGTKGDVVFGDFRQYKAVMEMNVVVEKNAGPGFFQNLMSYRVSTVWGGQLLYPGTFNVLGDAAVTP